MDEWEQLDGGAVVGPEDGAVPKNVLVVHHGHGGADERANPEDPLVVPSLPAVVHHGGTKASRRVDAGAGDGDGGQVDQEHREPDWQRGEDLSTFHTQ